MKSGIHPKYTEIQVTCSCGNTFTTSLDRGQAAARRSLLGLPSVLYREAEGHGHRRPHRQVPPALRIEDRRATPAADAEADAAYADNTSADGRCLALRRR